MKRRGLEYLHMLSDFPSVLSGRDYFHQPQGLGSYFSDPRCYYNDMIGKWNWRGNYHDNVPALYVPRLKQHIIFPIMVLQYGLGSIDRYFIQEDRSCLRNINEVAVWALRNLNSESYFDNWFHILDPQHSYHSSNSAMAQGEALSFLTRVVMYDLICLKLKNCLIPQIDGIFSNMILPLDRNGTALELNDELYFCEYCRTDGYVVLNGWIYTIFGLLDYYKWSKSGVARERLVMTTATLERVIGNYATKEGWSYYDNKGRTASPFYHAVHISLIDAVHRLTNRQEFKEIFDRFRSADTWMNNCLFTLRKIVDKLRDSTLYASEK